MRFSRIDNSNFYPVKRMQFKSRVVCGGLPFLLLVVLFALTIRLNVGNLLLIKHSDGKILPSMKRDRKTSNKVDRLIINSLRKTSYKSEGYEEKTSPLSERGSSNSRLVKDALNEMGNKSAKSSKFNKTAALNPTMSKLQRADSCRRRCPNYNNKIFLSSPPVGGAGLIDRLFVISKTLELAGYLCARLYIARPKFWLSPVHNQGKIVDIFVTWEEFGSFWFLDEDDGSHRSALVDWVDADNHILHPLVPDMLQSPEFRDWLYVRTSTSPEIVKHLDRIEAYSFGKTVQADQHHDYPGFLWDIRPNFFNFFPVLTEHMQKRHHHFQHSHLHNESGSNYTFLNQDWRSDMQPFGIHSPPEGCSYIKPVAAPKKMVDITTEILRQIQNETSDKGASAETLVLRPWIGYFHVRRGDVTSECDTSLQRIEAYLNCSVGASLSALASIKLRQLTNSSQPRPPQPVVLLFSSDEGDSTYRTELARLIEQQHKYQQASLLNASFTVSAVDLDQLIQSKLIQSDIPSARLNNFHKYRIIRYLELERAEIVFRLELRRSVCPACTNIMLQLVEHNVLKSF